MAVYASRHLATRHAISPPDCTPIRLSYVVFQGPCNSWYKSRLNLNFVLYILDSSSNNFSFQTINNIYIYISPPAAESKQMPRLSYFRENYLHNVRRSREVGREVGRCFFERNILELK